MKKLFNSRFLFILASSLVVLILLAVGAFYLFDDEDDVFVKSGYVLNPLSSTSEKYFFDENVGYKENLSSMIEFEDVDKNTVSILKDSFIHYTDESLSFLKKGAILDLDSVSGNKAVSFYNITDELIIEKKDSGYVIESANGDIRLNNFIGRISDNKYIVVGDLSLKMAGNDTTVKGDYFEVVYIEEGIVNIENKDVKYQVTAEDTFINVDNKVIDLGEKKITVNGQDLMSITAITIDGDENIEIIPKGNKDEEDDDNAGGGDGDGTGNGGMGGNNQQTGDGQGQDGENEGGTGNENIQTEPVNEVVISLKSVTPGSTNIEVVFDIVNAQEDDLFKLQVVNLASGRTVDISAVQVTPNSPINVPFLSPSTKYLFMVINEKDDGKYFQKILETNGFGIKMEKAYATDSSLVYDLTIDENTDVTNAKLWLKKFNEDTKQYEVVTVDAKDSDGNDIKRELVKDLASLGGNYKEIKFEGLESDTIYTAVIDGIAIGASDYGKTYEMSLTSMTLKETPDFTELTMVKDVGASSFDLSLGKIIDPDNAIVGYTYMIFNEDDRGNEQAQPVTTKDSTNASPVTVRFGSGEDELKSGANYYFKAVVEYFDNEKYVDFITDGSLLFNMENEPYITVEPNEEETTHNSIKADIYLTDSSCSIKLPGRTDCPAAESPISITVSEMIYGSTIEKKVVKVFEDVRFNISGNEIKHTLELGDLQPGTTYDISVKSIFADGDTVKVDEIKPTEQSIRIVTTKDLSSFEVAWSPNEANEQHVVYATSQLLALEPESNEISSEESLKEIDKVVLRLYEGVVYDDFSSANLITSPVTITGDIKEKFFDNPYVISSLDTFGISMDELAKRSKDEELNENYTIIFEAYTKTGKKVKIANGGEYPFYVPEYLRKEITKPELLDPIAKKNSEEGRIFKDLKGGTYVAFELTGTFNRESFIGGGYTPIDMVFNVYSEDWEKLKFYIKDENDELKLVDEVSVPLEEKERATVKVYMDYGTVYDPDIVEEIMTRGNRFNVGFYIKCNDDAHGGTANLPKDAEIPTGEGVYKLTNDIHTVKETPTLEMYVSKSDKNSITYKYKLTDPDNAVYTLPESDGYSSIYASINNMPETKFKLENAAEDDMKAFTINGLRTGDVYKIYYYTILKKYEKDAEGNIIPATRPVGDGSGTRIFDGHYIASENISNYSFTYEIINNPLADNKVTIRINAREDLLSRILSYEITFKDQNGNDPYIAKEWKLSECPNDSAGSVPRCISIKYDDIKKMKTEDKNVKINWITVSVVARYDNGLSGFDFKVGQSDSNDYQYCILQTNSSSDKGLGSYVAFNKVGGIETWREDLQVSKGYYTYTLNPNSIGYTSYFSGYSGNIYGTMGESGFSFGGHFLTPKMVSSDEMICTGPDCDKFYFDSIKPKIAVKKTTSLINGSVYKLTLSGIDNANDIVKEADGKRYLYIDTWEYRSDVGKTDSSGNIDKSLLARPTLKVELKDDPLEPVEAVIDGLKEYSRNVNNPSGTYYFNVYANMKNGYQQLPDEGNGDEFRAETYTLTSRNPGDLFQSIDTKTAQYVMSSTDYGVRTLNTKATLLPYDDKRQFNFDVVYALCHLEDECTLENNIYSTKGSVNTEYMMDISIDLSKENLGIDIEYNKTYKLYVFAIADYYSSPDQTVPGKQEILISRSRNTIDFPNLFEPQPSFTVMRDAKIIDGEAVVDLTITVNDYYQTLIGDSENGPENGKYFVKFQDEDGNLVGSMQLLDENYNPYYDVQSNYETYSLDAFEKPAFVRIRGLNPNTKYSVTVWSDAFINNYSENTSVEDRIVRISKSHTVYSSSDYGIAFGNEITYTATKNSIIVTFFGGSNFSNVVAVNYNVSRYDDPDNIYTKNGTFVIGENNKNFEYDTYWRFIIDPEGMDNTSVGDEDETNTGLKVVISLDVKDPNSGEIITLTSADIPGFEGTAEWVS